jgi:signal peptidase I
MAPTINGTHLVGVCSQCGGIAIVPKNNLGFNDRDSICSNCFAVNSVDRLRIFTATQEADRFVVNRWLKPRRWDVVVYRSKDDGTRLIAQRLVGLPGDTIMIRDGAIWIDGIKLVPPDQMGPVQYVADSIDESIIAFGPLTLKSGEFFVMGDFSQFSLDSRREGPVTESNIVGVVDLIYLPVKRFRILR